MSYLITIEAYDVETVVDLTQFTLSNPECNVISIRNGDQPAAVIDDIDDDDVDAADVISVLAKMNLSHDNNLSRMRDELVAIAERGGNIELSMRDDVPHVVTLDDVTDTDPTPPHGITRSIHDPNGTWPKGYWVDRRINPTQGSGPQIHGLERVTCTACDAPRDEVCVTERHAAYRRGYGHAARHVRFVALMDG